MRSMWNDPMAGKIIHITLSPANARSKPRLSPDEGGVSAPEGKALGPGDSEACDRLIHPAASDQALDTAAAAVMRVRNWLTCGTPSHQSENWRSVAQEIGRGEIGEKVVGTATNDNPRSIGGVRRKRSDGDIFDPTNKS